MNDPHLQRKSQDLRLAEVAVQQGILRPEQVQEGLRRLEDLEHKGAEQTLFDVLLRQGSLREEQVQDLRRLSANEPTHVLPEPPSVAGTLALTQGTAGSARASSLDQRGLPRPGDDFHGYVIRQELGRGGMGIVYEAFQESLKRRVALKILHLHLVADQEMVARFRREAESAARLAHPNIVHVYEFGEAGGLYFYVMEFLEGRTLDAWMRSPDHDPTVAARYCLDAARALDHAHHMGIIHRDIKPSNLMLTPEDKVYITDFGLARPEEGGGITMSGSVMGTPIYMSPEQALGLRKAIDRRSDIYSLAVTLYVLVTREPPFKGTEVHDVLRQVVDEDPTPPTRLVPGLSTDLEAILCKGMAKAREHRYQSALELAADLRRFLDGEPVDAARRRWFSGRTGRRRLKSLLAGAALLGMAGAAWPWLSPDGTRIGAGNGAANLPPGNQAAANSATPGGDPETLARLDREKIARDAENLDLRAKICEQEKRHEECLAYLEQAIRLQPDNPDRRRNLAIAHHNVGVKRMEEQRWQEALASFDKAAEYDESSNRLWICRGASLAHLGRHEDALASFEKSIRLRSDDPDAHLGIARIHRDRGQLEEAIAVVEFALRKAPDSRPLHAFRVETLIARRMPEAALEALADARKAVPDPAAWQQFEGSIALSRQDYEAAQAASSAVLEREPGRREARLDRAQARIGLRRWDDALADLDLLAADPGTIEPGSIASLRVVAHVESGRREEALAIATQALGREDLPDPVRHNLRYLGGVCRFHLGQIGEAAEDFRAVGASGAAEARNALWNLAQCQERLQQWKPAQATLEQLLRDFPDDPPAAERLRQLRERDGGD